MSKIHVECIPDECLITKLGFKRKDIVHHNSKSTVFNTLRKNRNEVAMVDEDPGPDQPKHPYERELILKHELYGIKKFIDTQRNNTVLVLKIRLENWIISLCKDAKINMDKDYNLSDKPNTLHREINNKLKSYERLLSDLLENNNPALIQLTNWIKSHNQHK